MQASFLILAAVAESVEEGGFGFNFNILETNLINLAILVGVLVFYGRKLLGNILSDRRYKIAEAIQEAEERQRKALVALTEQQQKLAQAQAEAKRIEAAALERAEAAKAQIAAKTEEDIQRLRNQAQQDLNAQKERAIAELRERIANMSLVRVESQLRNILGDKATEQQLINQSIARLGGG
jgi:F-type H+-transporting ATPase subunit b